MKAKLYNGNLELEGTAEEMRKARRKRNNEA